MERQRKSTDDKEGKSMSEWQISLIFIGTLIGGFCVGYLWAHRETAF